MWDMMPHKITIATYLLGKYPDEVSAEGDDDNFKTEMNFGEVLVESTGSWLSNIKKRQIIVEGDKGSANYEDNSKQLAYEIGKYSKGVDFDTTPPLMLEVKHFLDCVKNRKKPLTDGNEGLKSVQVIEALQKSMDEKGKKLKLTFS